MTDSSRGSIPAGDVPAGGLRRTAARGTIVNSAFQVGLYGLGTLERTVVAAWLTPGEYGFWGILFTALMALMFIKNAGIVDKYVQQSEPDQEKAFQKAFTIELALSGAFFVLAAVALPVYALAYGRPQMIVPGLVLALAVPITSLEAPAWIPYRRMQYRRQRTLASVDPVVTSIAAIALVAGGLGYWGMVLGALAGSVTGAAVCLATCPYRLRLRIDRDAIREYVSFSWPLLSYSLCGAAILQGTLLVANDAVGLAGIGAIGLVANVSGIADGVDAIVSQTIYPAICAAAQRREVLAEAFVKSNRIALMWAMPVTVGIGLFAGDLVHFVLGDKWHSAVGLLAAVTVTCGFGQVAFNWAIFFRAVNDTKPILKVRIVQLAAFALVCVPAILALGLTGYAIGLAAMTVAEVVARGYYVRRLFHGFSVLTQLVRSVLPVVPPAAAILVLRVALGGHRSAARVVAELALFGALAVASTLVLERSLVRELADYLRRPATRPAAPVIAAAQPTG